MIEAIITTIIASLILLAIGLSLKIVQLTHRNQLLQQENENIIAKHHKLEDKHSDFKETSNKKISALQKKNVELAEPDDFISCSANIRDRY